MSSVLERIEKLEASINEVVGRVTSPDPMVMQLMQKTVAIEQSVMSMGKTLSAMSAELTENGVLDGAAVIARLRQAEDENSRQQIKLLLKENAIEPADVISSTSLVVIEQKVVNIKSGEATLVSNYNLIGMGSPMTNQVWKTAIQDKKVGDTVRGIAGNNEEEVLTIKEIYEIKEREVEGEPTPPDLDNSGSEDSTDKSNTYSKDEEPSTDAGAEDELSFDDGSDKEEAGA